MIRVLQVLQNLDMGGAESYVMNIYREMNRSVVQFDFAVQHKGGFFEEEIKNLGGNIYYLPHFKIYNGRLFEKELFDLLKDHPEISIVHSHNNNFGAFAMRASKKAKVKAAVSHAHTNKKHMSNWKDAIYCMINPYTRYLFSRNTDFCLACSKEAGIWQYGRKASFKVAPNCIDVDRFAFNAEVRNRLKIQYGLENNTVLGHVGRLEKVKNQSFLLKVFSKVKEIDSRAVLLIIGEGSEKNKLFEMSKKMGISDSTIFLENKADIENYYQLMDMFLLPSFYEGFPMTLVEAQAAGLRCVVSDRICKDTNVNGNVTYLSIDKGTEIWSKTIIDIIQIPRKMDTNGLRAYDIKKNAGIVQQFYLDIS